MTRKTVFALFASACSLAATLPVAASVPPVHAPTLDRYPYGTAAFSRLIADSDRVAGAGTPREFYQWLDQAPLARASHGLLNMTAAEKKRLDALRTPAQKTAEERSFCTRLHHMVKTYLPNFSLDEGFEFTNAVSKGERQCLLQSVLLAGLLQRTGVDAGIVMVWRNLRGQETNNSHCVTLVHLSDGKDAELDASDPVPFVKHQGLLGEQNGLRDIEPVFAGDTPTIVAYKATGDGARLTPHQVRPLDYAFVQSQFDYYRGERAPGGLLSPQPTPAGLQTEADYLHAAIRRDPGNALAVYMLGRVSLRQGRKAAARRQLSLALGLYADAGWTPAGPRDLAAEILPPARSAETDTGKS